MTACQRCEVHRHLKIVDRLRVCGVFAERCPECLNGAWPGEVGFEKSALQLAVIEGDGKEIRWRGAARLWRRFQRQLWDEGLQLSGVRIRFASDDRRDDG